MSPGRVVGNLDSDRIDLHVVDDGTRLYLHGDFGGRMGKLSLDAQALEGSVGNCGYDLRRSGPTTFEGRSCGGINTSLRLPLEWDELSATERATWLTLLLST